MAVHVGNENNFRQTYFRQENDIDAPATSDWDEGLGFLPVGGTGSDAKLELDQNYPNPFNPSTVIGYRLPDETNVRLIVHDLLGRRVLVLVDRQQEAGYHQVTRDASANASGVYFYRLKTPQQTITRRMTLIR